MTFQRAEQQKTVEGCVLFVLFQECSAYGFEKRLIVTCSRKLFQLFDARIAVLAGFVFQNSAVELFLVIEVPKNDRFVNFRVGRQVAGRRTSKSLLSEEFHRSCEDVTPAVMLHK